MGESGEKEASRLYKPFLSSFVVHSHFLSQQSNSPDYYGRLRSIMHFLNMRTIAIFTCLVFLQLSINDAHSIHRPTTAIVGRHRQSGRKLVNLQRFIRNDQNLEEDYQQFEIGTTREPVVPTTEDFSVILEQETFGNTEAPTTPVTTDWPVELPSFPLDANILETTENIVTPLSDAQDAPVLDTTESTANGDITANYVVEILVTPQNPMEEIELQSSSNPTDPPQSYVQTYAPTDLPFNSDAAPMDVSTEMATEKLEYSSISSIDEEEQESISSSVVLSEISTEAHEPAVSNSESLTTIVEKNEQSRDESMTEAPQSSDDAEPLDPIDFPLFYPAVTVKSVPQKAVDLNQLNPSWSLKTSDSLYADQQLLSQHEDKKSGLLNKIRTPIYPRVIRPHFKPSQSLYAPDLFYTFGPIVQQSNQPKFQQDPPRAPYPDPHGSNSPFYRPFESAPPKPRMLAFPPISNTRENFRFRVNWTDDLGRSDWA